MRQPKRDKQNMYYALFAGKQPVYEKDADGHTIYIYVDGRPAPLDTGIKVEKYSTPVKFKASITSTLNEMHIRAWGVDQSAIQSVICCKKGYLPLQIGSLIWRTSEIEWEDKDKTIPKPSSADYTVCGLMDESLTEDFYLLKRNSSDESN